MSVEVEVLREFDDYLQQIAHDTSTDVTEGISPPAQYCPSPENSVTQDFCSNTDSTSNESTKSKESAAEHTSEMEKQSEKFLHSNPVSTEPESESLPHALLCHLTSFKDSDTPVSNSSPDTLQNIEPNLRNSNSLVGESLLPVEPHSVTLILKKHILRYLIRSGICEQLNIDHNVRIELNVGMKRLTVTGTSEAVAITERKLKDILGSLSHRRSDLDVADVTLLKSLNPQTIISHFKKSNLVIGWCMENDTFWMCSDSDDNIKRANVQIKKLLLMNEEISAKLTLSCVKLMCLVATGGGRSLAEKFNVKLTISSKSFFVKICGPRCQVSDARKELQLVTSNYLVESHQRAKIIIKCLKGISFEDVQKSLDATSPLVGWKILAQDVVVCGSSHSCVKTAVEAFDNMVSCSQYPKPNKMLSSFQLKATKVNSDWTTLAEELKKANVHLEVDYKAAKVRFAHPSSEDESLVVTKLDNFFAPLVPKSRTIPLQSLDVEKLFVLNQSSITVKCQLVGDELVTLTIAKSSCCLLSYSEQSLAHAQTTIQSIKVFTKIVKATNQILIDWINSSTGIARLKTISDTYRVIAKTDYKDKMAGEDNLDDQSNSSSILKAIDKDISKTMV